MRSKWRISFVAGLVLIAGLYRTPQMRAQSVASYSRAREVLTRIPVEGAVLPKWNGETLLGVENGYSKAPILYLIDAEGRREEILFTIPESNLIIVHDVARGNDGAIAVAGWAANNSAKGATFIASISSDRKRQTVTRVSPYCPNRLTIGPGGTIWTVGFRNDDTITSVVERNIVRRFDSTGKLIGTRTMEARPTTDHFTDVTSNSYMVASRDRVGWFTQAGEYFEFSAEGVQLDHFDGPSGITDHWMGGENHEPHPWGVALSPGNLLTMCIRTKDSWKVMAFDRETRTWRTPVSQQKGFNFLAGFNGGDLVLIPQWGNVGRLHHYKADAGSSAR